MESLKATKLWVELGLATLHHKGINMAITRGAVAIGPRIKSEVFCFTGIHFQAIAALWTGLLFALGFILALVILWAPRGFIRVWSWILQKFFGNVTDEEYLKWLLEWLQFLNKMAADWRWLVFLLVFGLIVLFILIWYWKWVCRCPNGNKGACFVVYSYKTFWGGWIPYAVLPHGDGTIRIGGCRP